MYQPVFHSLALLIAYVSSYPDGGCRNHMGVAHSSCYKLLTAKMALINVNYIKTIGIALSCFESESTGREYQD